MDTSDHFPSAPGISLLKERNALVLPGEQVSELKDAKIQTSSGEERRPVVRLGSGVTQHGMKILAVKAGLLQLDEKRSRVWIESNQKRYEPGLEDMVIGFVTERHADEYRLNINGTDTATLSTLAFEGATKRNKPNLSIGAAVYCRVTLASKNMECEVSCIAPGSRKSWVSGDTTYGELKGGNIVQVSLGLARSLLLTNGNILNQLSSKGNKLPFELAVGVNGRVWVKSNSIKTMVVISSALLKADTMPADKWNILVPQLLAQATAH